MMTNTKTITYNKTYIHALRHIKYDCLSFELLEFHFFVCLKVFLYKFINIFVITLNICSEIYLRQVKML